MRPRLNLRGVTARNLSRNCGCSSPQGSGFVMTPKTVEKIAAATGVSAPTAALAGGPTQPGTSPVPEDPAAFISETLYTSTDYTGNPANIIAYPVAPTPEFLAWYDKLWTHFTGWRFWANDNSYKLQQLHDQNTLTAWAVVRELSDIDVLWILGNLVERPHYVAGATWTAMGVTGQFAISADTAEARRTSLIVKLSDMFTEKATDLSDFLRIALEGAQPITADNATAWFTAALGKREPKETQIEWNNQFRMQARGWLTQRQAYRWPVVAEILAGLEIRLDGGLPGYKGRQPSAGGYPPGLKFGETQKSGQSRTAGWVLNLDLNAIPEDERGWAVNVPGAKVAPWLVWYAWRGWRTDALKTNRLVSYAMAEKLPADKVAELAGEFGVKGELSRDEQRAAMAETWASMATEQNQSLLVNVGREAVAKGLPIDSTLTALLGRSTKPWGSAGNFFSDLAKGFKKLVRHPVKWVADLGNDIAEGIGRILTAVGKEVKRWGRVPILGDFFIAPLAIDFVFGEVFVQIGNALQDHSISTIDEKALGLGVGRVFTSAGRACAMVAPFTPPPVNLILGAVAVVSIAAGMTITTLINQSDVEKAYQQYNEQQQEAFKAEVAAAKLKSEQDAARQQQQLEQTAAAAQASLLQWLNQQGLMGSALLNASQPGGPLAEPDREIQSVSKPGLRGLAIAAGAVGFVGLLTLIAWGSTRAG